MPAKAGTQGGHHCMAAPGFLLSRHDTLRSVNVAICDCAASEQPFVRRGKTIHCRPDTSCIGNSGCRARRPDQGLGRDVPRLVQSPNLLHGQPTSPGENFRRPRARSQQPGQVAFSVPGLLHPSADGSTGVWRIDRPMPPLGTPQSVLPARRTDRPPACQERARVGNTPRFPTVPNRNPFRSAVVGYPYASYRLRLDPVVSRMSADEFHQNPPVCVGNMHNQAVPVATDVEDKSVVADEIYRGSKLRFHVCRAVPLRPADRGMPRPKRCFGAKRNAGLLCFRTIP